MKFDILLPLYRPRGNWDEPICEAITAIRAALNGKGEVHLYITNDGAAPEYRGSIAAAADGISGFLP